MTIIRSNPLPPGFYWQDISQSKDEPAWTDWVHRNAGKVQIHTVSGSKDLVWTLFEVLQPVTWEGPGYPTVAPKGGDTLPDDVIQAPTVEEPSEVLEREALKLVHLAGWGIAIGLGVYTLGVLRKRG